MASLEASVVWVCARELEPKRATDGAAGYDLRADEDVVVYPAWWKLMTGQGPTLVKTSLKWIASPGVYMKIESRSGMAAKRHTHVVAGVIDSDYRGEIRVALDNRGLLPLRISRCERIAQGIILRHESPATTCRDTLDEQDATARGDGGFGSTGK